MACQHRLPQMIPSALAVHTAVSKNSSPDNEELKLLPVTVEEGDVKFGEGNVRKIEDDSFQQTNKDDSSVDDGDFENNTEESLNGETHQSRYGRVRKKRSLGPDMELTPLFRTYKRNKADETGRRSQTNLDSWLDQNKVIKQENGNGVVSSSEASHENGVVDHTRRQSNNSDQGDESYLGGKILQEKRRGRPPKDPSKHGPETKEIPRRRGRPPKGASNDAGASPVKSTDDVDNIENVTNSPRGVRLVQASVQCNVGDLLWSKIPGHPWWPCMVAYNPFKGIYSRIIKKKNGSCRSFHVQYFGSSAQRGWTMDGGVMIFEGREAFDALSRRVLATSTNPKYDRFLSGLKIPQSRVATWEAAVEEAENALKMSREKRIDELTFEYKLPHGQRLIPVVPDSTPTKIKTPKKQNGDLEKTREKQQRSEVQRNESEKTTVNGVSQINGGERHTDKASSGAARVNGVAKKNSTAEIITPRPKSKNSNFDVYVSKHVGDVMGEYPEFSREEAEGYLHFQWDCLLEAQKTRYTSKFVDDTAGDRHVNGVKTVVRERRAKRTLSSITDRMSEADTDISETSSAMDEKCLPNGDCCRNDKVCHVCEVMGNVITCKGPCMQSFHSRCIGLTKVPPTFLCPECSTGKHKCFSCKKDEGEVQKCSVSSCGRYYHQGCLDQGTVSTQYDNRIVCPLHTCHTCFLEMSKSQHCRKGRMLRCIRCPTAFHTGENCISAGSICLTSTHILCAKHFQPQKNNKFHLHVNATWCFVCSEGGKLICCESCPGAFHPECLEIETPEGNYYCRDCTEQKQLCYGDIIWVKLGCYRWWPAEVQNPSSVPLNIQNLEHKVGEFPVYFFGSHDYFWVHKGRVFLFHEGDKGTKDSSNGRYLAQVFQRAVEEATDAFQKWKCRKETRVAQIESLKPPPYKHIKSNRPVGKVQITPVDPITLTPCECNPDASNPCSSDVECMNRILMFECHPNVCQAREKCCNQRFQKREYAAAKPFRTEGRGWGLQAEQDIKAGEFVSEYVGELIDEEECKNRLQKSNTENESNFYFLTIEKDKIVDAGPKGNLSRFMNHSCQPNCETQKWTVSGDTRVGLFAICDIAKGAELTFNYNLDCCGNDKLKCGCGSSNCSGYIGIRPKTAIAASQEKKMKENVGKKRKKKSFLRKHDDECYRCGEGGELMMCDRKTCTKSYHLNCLGLTKPSHGRWECPWHHCDDCGNISTIFCSYCPNSFCKVHATMDKIWTKENGRVRCSEHDDEELEEYDRNPSPDDSA